jgi:serine/threonine-protein kinase
MLRTIPTGSRLGRYEIKSQLGVGGMGEVYLAQDTNLRRPVALKLLLAKFTQDEDRLRRFEQEACAASALNHPNILTIYEVGSENDVRFIATEFIDGVTLRQQMGHTPMRPAQALDIATQAASALATAHEAGIVHRDIKPENIMLRSDGYIKLLDFGLLKLTENSSAHQRLAGDSSVMVDTDPGILMGTVKYMSPEQARGFEVDGRTDIWSLGVVLYEMLTGRLPFGGGSTTDILVSILQHAPAPLGLYAADIPAELDRIVALALAKDQEDRYQTSREFASDLKSLWQELEFKAKFASSSSSRLDVSDEERRTGDDAQQAVELSRNSAASPEKSSSRALASARRRRSRKAIDSLAILPLFNVSADKNAEYFSDGITESIINNLSQLPRLRVMARSTVFRYRGEEVDPQEVGRELGVRAVMTGRVLHLDDNLIIKAELVDANDGAHLWGEQYNRKMVDAFSVQQEISREISEKLRFKLTGEEQKRLTRRSTENPEAYQFYLKGRYCWNKRTPEGFRKAIEHFEEAIEIDHLYAAAYAGLADSYNMLGTYSALAPREAFPRAKAAAKRALEIDDTLAEAHTSLGYVENSYDWDWMGAEFEFKRAIELNPSYATAHYWYAITHLAAMGRLNEAKSELTQAKELDPLSLIIGTNLGWLSYFARQYDRAIEQYQKTIELDANFGVAYYKLGQAYERKGLPEEAIVQYRKALYLSINSPGIMSALGHACAQAGKPEEARHVLDELNEMSKQRYVSPYFIAEVYRGLGELDKTFEWLEKAVADRSDWLVWIGVEPAFDDLRSDPRFVNLLQRIGLSSAQTQPVLDLSAQSLEQLSAASGESESTPGVAPPENVTEAFAAVGSHNEETIEVENPPDSSRDGEDRKKR